MVEKTGMLLVALALALLQIACWEEASVVEGGDCHPSYEGACLDPDALDYDCEGGAGDGPEYTGPVRVVGPDDFGLDGDGDGGACEWSWDVKRKGSG